MIMNKDLGINLGRSLLVTFFSVFVDLSKSIPVKI